MKVKYALVVFLAFTALHMVNGSYLLGGDFGWKETRKPGESLEGYWYSPSYDSGCFEQSAVVKVEGKRLFFIKNGYKIDALMKTVRQDGELFIEVNSIPGVAERHYFDDLGTELDLHTIKYVKHDGSTKVHAAKDPLIRTCDTPTTEGVFRSFFQTVFDPNQPVSTVTETQ